MKLKYPNFLFFVVDEQRYPPSYESPELREWKRNNLPFQEEFARKATVFHNHYTNTSACCPARGTIHTGQYPAVHGVTQTDGIAISAQDSEMTWLPKFTVPTIGNYLEELGYLSIIKGKWHVSDADIYDNNGDPINTFDNNGNSLHKFEEFYLQKDQLGDYGYHGWIGPEPHGSLPLNSGSCVPPPEVGRDVKYADQLVAKLEELEFSSKPWFLNATFVNPHDIAVFGLYSNLGSSSWDFPVDETLPEVLFTPEFERTHLESLATKPPAQKYYRDLYKEFLQPIPPHLLDKYYRVYYTLQKQVDQDMLRVWNKLKSLQCYKETISLFISDHGELLSAHSDMHQKWYNAYQETIHVPFMVSSPLLGNKHQDVTEITSHIDIAATILGFAGHGPAYSSYEKLRAKLSKNFTLALPLPGQDLSEKIEHGFSNSKKKSSSFYFYTEDQPDNGPNQVGALCQPYESVPQPCNVDAILVKYKGELWKLTRYYDKNGTCSTPNSKNGGSLSPSNEQGELYNLDQDPLEIHNLIEDPTYSKIFDRLNALLSDKSFLYRGFR